MISPLQADDDRLLQLRGVTPMIRLPHSDHWEDVVFGVNLFIYACKKGWVEKEVCVRVSPLLLLVLTMSYRRTRA
jgi:hypothetical protein